MSLGMQTRSKTMSENYTTELLSSHDNDDNDDIDMNDFINGNPIQQDYVSKKDFNSLYDDFIDFKKYMAEVLNLITKSNKKPLPDEFSGKEYSQADLNLLHGQISALQNENTHLKQQNENFIKIIEILSHSANTSKEEIKRTNPVEMSKRNQTRQEPIPPPNNRAEFNTKSTNNRYLNKENHQTLINDFQKNKMRCLRYKNKF